MNGRASGILGFYLPLCAAAVLAVGVLVSFLWSAIVRQAEEEERRAVVKPSTPEAMATYHGGAPATSFRRLNADGFEIPIPDQAGAQSSER